MGPVQGHRTKEEGDGIGECRDKGPQAPRHGLREAAEGRAQMERLEAASRTDGLVASACTRDGAVWSGLRWEDLKTLLSGMCTFLPDGKRAVPHVAWRCASLTEKGAGEEGQVWGQRSVVTTAVGSVEVR